MAGPSDQAKPQSAADANGENQRRRDHHIAEERYQASFALPQRGISSSSIPQVAREDPLSGGDDDEDDQSKDAARSAAPRVVASGKARLVTDAFSKEDEEDAIVPSSPYFGEKEAAEAMAWFNSTKSSRRAEALAAAATSTGLDNQAADFDEGMENDESGGIAIARKRRDSQVGSYEAGGSIFDGPSAGAIPSSVSS